MAEVKSLMLVEITSVRPDKSRRRKQDKWFPSGVSVLDICVAVLAT